PARVRLSRPSRHARKASTPADCRRLGSLRRRQLCAVPPGARPAHGSGEIAIETTRRDFLIVGTKTLVMPAATASAREHVLAGTLEATAPYTTADHWWAMLID